MKYQGDHDGGYDYSGMGTVSYNRSVTLITGLEFERTTSSAKY
jgi:hypothetical protein